MKSTSSLVKAPAPEIVYKNVNIWVGTSGFAVPANIKTAEIMFRTENSWLGDNSLKDSDIKMVRWDGSKWNTLETAVLKNDGTYTYFAAKTNAFSPFAVIGQKEITTTETSPVATTEPAETSVSTTEVPPAGTQPTNWAIIIGVLIVIGIVVIVYLKGKGTSKK